MSELQSAIAADDYDLMKRIRAGDRAALESLYDRYSALVMSVCVRMLNNRAEAEDCLIDIFFEIWQRADRYDPNRAAPMPYLLTVTRSRALDRRRTLARRSLNLEEGDIAGRISPELSRGSAADDPLAASVLAESRTHIQSALKSLQPAQRQAIESAYYEGLSHSEIAEKLGKPLGTVKTYIRGGLMQLRDFLRKGELT